VRQNLRPQRCFLWKRRNFMNSRKTLAFPSLLGTLLSLVLFGILVAGCGSSSTGGVTPPTTNPTSVSVQKCGAINVMRSVSPNVPTAFKTGPGSPLVSINGTVKADVAGNCFWQAFQQCHAASLVVNFGGVDTITTHTFTLQKQNTNCIISDAVQNRIVPRPAKNIGNYTCTGLVSATNELRFNGCGKLGNVVVPTSQVGNPQ